MPSSKPIEDRSLFWGEGSGEKLAGRELMSRDMPLWQIRSSSALPLLRYGAEAGAEGTKVQQLCLLANTSSAGMLSGCSLRFARSRLDRRVHATKGQDSSGKIERKPR